MNRLTKIKVKILDSNGIFGARHVLFDDLIYISDDHIDDNNIKQKIETFVMNKLHVDKEQISHITYNYIEVI